ncbi:hypothetical protein ACTA71_012111 [Dictyostelium dimigraforme]
MEEPNNGTPLIYHFLLVVECKSAVIRADGGINGIDIGNFTIKIEQFTDNTATIAESIEEHKMMDQIVQKFCSEIVSKLTIQSVFASGSTTPDLPIHYIHSLHMVTAKDI